MYYARGVRALFGLLLATGIALAEKPDDFVDVAAVIPDAVIDMRYATADNFTKQQVYPVATCKLRRSVATPSSTRNA